jgi:hypothetical protein
MPRRGAPVLLAALLLPSVPAVAAPCTVWRVSAPRWSTSTWGGNRSQPTPVLVFGAGARAETVEGGLSFHAATGEGIRHFDFYTDISLGLRF